MISQKTEKQEIVLSETQTVICSKTWRKLNSIFTEVIEVLVKEPHIQ